MLTNSITPNSSSVVCYGPNTREVIHILGQLQSMTEHESDQIIIAMHDLGFAASVGEGDELARLVDARFSANQLVANEFAIAWQRVQCLVTLHFEGRQQPHALVEALNDTLLGAVCKYALHPAEYELLTNIWYQAFWDDATSQQGRG